MVSYAAGRTNSPRPIRLHSPGCSNRFKTEPVQFDSFNGTSSFTHRIGGAFYTSCFDLFSVSHPIRSLFNSPLRLPTFYHIFEAAGFLPSGRWTVFESALIETNWLWRWGHPPRRASSSLTRLFLSIFCRLSIPVSLPIAKWRRN